MKETGNNKVQIRITNHVNLVFPEQYFLDFIIALILFLGSSEYVRKIGLLNNIIDMTHIVVFLYFGMKAVFCKRVNGYLVSAGLFYVCLAISTILGTKDYAYFHYMLQGMSATLFVSDRMQENSEYLLKALRDAVIVVLLINLFFLIIQPYGFMGSGNKTFYFLGYRIAFTPFAFAAVFCSYLYDVSRKRTKNSNVTWFALGLAMLTVVLRTVSTGIVSIVLFVGMVMACYLLNSTLIKLWQVYIIYAVVFVSVVIFNIQNTWKPLAFFLTEVLGKDVTFNNRTFIWASAVQRFLESPVWGHGTDPDGGINAVFKYATKLLSAHNQILNILCDGGLVMLGAFILMLLFIARAVEKTKVSQVKMIVIAGVIAWLVIMITEIQTTKAIVFLMFAVMGNCNRVLESPNKVAYIFRHQL